MDPRWLKDPAADPRARHIVQQQLYRLTRFPTDEALVAMRETLGFLPSIPSSEESVVVREKDIRPFERVVHVDFIDEPYVRSS